jgi:hypothetical protein
MRLLGHATVVLVGLAAIGAFAVLGLRSPSDGHVAAAEPATDLLEQQSRQLAGPGAVDCGEVLVDGNPKAATDCALAANKAGKPFRVRYDIRGIDSFLAVAIVRTSIGTVGALQYDSDPAGGGGRAHEVVYPKRCPEPVHLWVNPSGRINCFQKQSSRPRDVMSPNAEPY